MRYLKIQTIRDEMTGELSFNLKKNGMPNNGEEVLGGFGMIIAHDILEHQQGLEKIGTLEDELIALGGVLFVRGNTGELSKGMYSAEENIAFDLTRMFTYFGDRTKRTGIKYYPKRIAEEWDDCFVDECIKIARLYLIKNDCEEYYQDEDKHERKPLIDPYLKWAKHLIRYGIYKAEKRFGDSHTAVSMFKRIENRVDRFTPEYEGEEFILGYNSHSCTMRRIEIWEDNY